ncbi:hypothetical protein C8R45DRAFT_1189557 [Mycena sanguinolenta]|nr:hypothetical protein C8R45DRAFT_1189557 [Mycena sanguinolenta]
MPPTPNIWQGNETVWHAWEPACDTCGRTESEAPKKTAFELRWMSSKACQQTDWKDGHKNQCHLYEANRKLSSVFAKSLGPGTLNDPRLSLEDKLTLWRVRVHRTFFIDRVLLLDREASNAAAQSYGWTKGSAPDSHKGAERTDTEHFKVMVGWCTLTKRKTSGSQMWTPTASDAAEHVLPPGYDLNQFVNHAEIESMEMPEGWWDYVERHDNLLGGMKGGQGFVGYINPDGAREPVYKWDDSGHFRRCAPGETDFEGTEQFKKQLVDPSKTVRLISKHLTIFEEKKRAAVETNLFKTKALMEDVMRKIGQGHRH